MCLCCNLTSLRVSIRIIETAADFFADTKRVALVPLFFLVLSIITLFGFIYGYICISSIGDIKVDNIALQTKTIDHPNNIVLAQWLMIFGCLWTIAFLLSCNEFVIVVSAATWYFSNKQIPDDDGIPGDAEVFKGFLWIPLYHFGSLAIGSLTITLVWIIRGAFEYVARHTQGVEGDGGCSNCLISSIRCCLGCFDRLMRYLTKNAYIYMAISSESFCSSALNSFILMLKNAAKFAFVEGFSDFFMFIAKLSISIFTAATGLVILLMNQTDSPVSSPIFPGIVMLLTAYIISGVFVQIFDTAANTILQCYLMDADVAKQRHLEPTHVPATLARFLKDNCRDDHNSVELIPERTNLIQ